MATLPERMTALEVELAGLKGDVVDVKLDVKEVKADVKTLLLQEARSGGVVRFIQITAPWVAIIVATAAVITR